MKVYRVPRGATDAAKAALTRSDPSSDKGLIMPKPPKTPPHSDIEGVNRDARAGTPSKSPHPDPGAAIEHARDQSKGRPQQTSPRR